MFQVKRTIGQHTVLSIDTLKHQFIEYFKKIYNTDSLNTLHLRSAEYTKNDLCDIETDLHKHFYKSIKQDDEFKRLRIEVTTVSEKERRRSIEYCCNH